MRLHVPSLPWTQTTSDYPTCAYTNKVIKFCRMMMSIGHEVILYSGEQNEAECTEHHVVITEEERNEWYGGVDAKDIVVSDKVSWDTNHPAWVTMNRRVGAYMAAYGDPRDSLACFITSAQMPALDAVPAPRKPLAVEWGIGYEGVHPGTHWCFESSAWMHWVYGLRGMRNGRYFDTVIPNSFDPDDFPIQKKPAEDKYLLFIGRIIERKGVATALKIAERAGYKLVIAGPGGTEWGDGWLRADDGVDLAGNLEYIGPLGPERRAEVMGGALATLVPTFYIEPFGGVAVESMLCGTPVVATPWGAFRETVVHGETGYTFHTLSEGLLAVDMAQELDREDVALKARARYSIWNVRHRYEEWLHRVMKLWGDGWNAV